jgi:endonuclease-8
MPEGDTIFRSAQTLHRALAGNTVESFRTVLAHLARVNDDTPLAGRVVERVESRGKHLLMFFSGDLILRTHMRMHGSWHIYRRGERWQAPATAMRLVVATAEFEAVAFDVPVAEFRTARTLAHDRAVQPLGPDLLDDASDTGEAVGRLRALGDAPIEDGLLDQRVAAGVGNVFKSEVLFEAGIHPASPVSALDDAALSGLLAIARRQLRRNAPLTPGPPPFRSQRRNTTGRLNPAESLWVYGRAGRPCLKCGSAIERFQRGEAARLTYYCPTCQPAGR